MDTKTKHQWAEEETQHFVELWASSEVQNRLEGASRTKPVFERIQSQMVNAGYDRTLVQLINKLKKLKKDYWNHKRKLEHSGGDQLKKIPHFDLLDSVMGFRPAGQTTGALNSATAAADETVTQTAADTDLLSVDAEVESICCSPPPSTTAASSPHQTRLGKRKREWTGEVMEYLQRSEEQFLEQTRRHQTLTHSLMQQIQKMDRTTCTLISLMGRMVSVMEALSHK